jgi:putative membrane protein insertion efficiency factor
MNLAVRVSVCLIRGYQRWLSPLLGAHCRFYPSCSQYALLAMTEWGFFKGLWLSVRRLVKCGPWHEGGCDPVPLKRSPETPVNAPREVSGDRRGPI